MTDPVATFVTEAEAFVKRHPDLSEVGASFGGMAWGFLLAIAECPDCPGTFRVPTDKTWDTLVCPRCENAWSRT